MPVIASAPGMAKQLSILALVMLVATCSGGQRADEPLPPVDPTRIDHAQHAKIGVPCDGCHRSGEKRPGVNEHRPCDDGACHRKEFLAAPGKLCQVCHEEVTATPLVVAKLRRYPSDGLWQ